MNHDVSYFPAWFRACQALMCFELICNLLSLFLCVTYMVEQWRRKIYGDRYVLIHIINAVLLFSSGNILVIVMSTFVSVFTIGASAARACCVLMVKILTKCILSTLVYNLFLDRQRNILYTTQYFHTQLYWLSSWNRN